MKKLSCPPEQNNVKNDCTYVQLSQPILQTDAHKAEKDLRWNSVSLHLGTDSSVWVTDPNNRIRTVNKVISEIEN